MSDYTMALHKHYASQARQLVEAHFKGNTSVQQQLDEFSRILALSMWSDFKIPQEDCIEAVNEIYSTTNPPLDMSQTQIKRVLEDQTFDPTEKIPKFFASLVRDDVRHNLVHSRMFAEEYQNIVLMFALIDNDISVEEAAYINKYFQNLMDYCDREGVIATYHSFDANTRVFKAADLASQVKNKETADETLDSSEQMKKTKAPAKSQETAAEAPGQAMEDLKNLVGLSGVKKEIEGIANFARIQKLRAENGLNCPPMSYHLVFTGNPGTGKTTVARIVSRIYKDLGLLTKGHLVEVDRGGLVAGYVGQTATKTKEVLDSALGGVLFIDEAYTLASEDDKGFGQEAIDTILKYMEDNRENICIIVAGYDGLMEDFIDSNPGLRSRFTRYIHFDDYEPDQLMAIFMQSADRNQYKLKDEVKEALAAKFKELYESRDENFGNGRTVRTYFEQVITNQANRLAAENDISKEDLMTIALEDL